MGNNFEKSFTEIGGNFWLKPDQWDHKSDVLSKDLFIEKAKDVVYTSSGRGAIRLFLEQINCESKAVLLPYFTCDSVLKPFVDNNYEIIYYEIENDFSINIDKMDILLKKYNPSILFLQSYFGFNTLKNIAHYITDLKENRKICIVEDITHSLLGKYNHTNADYYLGSIRKWLEVPDGGILISNNTTIDCSTIQQHESVEITELFIEASKLKYDYTINLTPEHKDKYRKLFYKAEHILNGQKEIFPISAISRYLLTTADFSAVQSSRRANYNYLYENLSEMHSFQIVFPKAAPEVAPLYFCVDCRGKRIEIQKKLSSEEIYAPVIWPKSDYLTKANSNHETFFYEDLLSIPCDQRYDVQRIKNIVKILKTC